jgi:geranylgeranyl diphosphate synthase type II
MNIGDDVVLLDGAKATRHGVWSNSLALPASTVDALFAIDSRLTDFFAGRAGLIPRSGPLFTELWCAIRRSTLGGKRFRPALVVNTCCALGGGAGDDVVSVATAVELLHTAFLLHDDVIDGDTVRRGRPNLIGEFERDGRVRGMTEDDALDWACSAAILAGDLLIHSALAMVARVDVDARRRYRLIDLFEESVFVTAAGELHDVAFGTGRAVPSADEVLEMTEWKTANYSFQLPLNAGAVLAGAAEHTTAALTEYGRRVGIAFQLRDDLLGVFGSERLTGKSTLSDLRGAKVTVLAAFALDSALGQEWRSVLAEPGTDGAIARARDILASCGGYDHVEGLIDTYVADAIGVLDAAELPAGLRAYLVRVAEGASQRTS